MKQIFSIKWKSSKQTRKQRKYRANAPLNVRHKMMSANLSKELRKTYGKRSFPVRKGDTIKIMRGKFSKKTGKINGVDLKKLRVSIEGIQRNKKDGTKVNVYFNSSNLQIQELSLGDKEREKLLKIKQKAAPKGVPLNTEEGKTNKKGEKNAPEKK